MPQNITTGAIMQRNAAGNTRTPRISHHRNRAKPSRYFQAEKIKGELRQTTSQLQI
jgi:hypothetical protein